ncbi:uncharacterized protein LOC125714966 isoform X2 [Brienomyrus brachyistius]|uniref:uncharacterized protein LOC125714966 isoform X2 n=1 Tax=Brienomyrus brachyistius TaxID=42636 RepID=UPI0020B20FE7|nr:uncharacterized protein LOC125714966 isoform X2 [Brienomyrus brachyistius]
MSSNATEFRKSTSTHSLPADHVLCSGAVTFPGAFDQQGCPVVFFPVALQSRLTSDLKKEEVVYFINYFLQLHNKYQERSTLLSVVVDFRNAALTTARFVAETLLLLELPQRTVHTLYVVQPKKRDVLKLLLKLLMSGHAKTGSSAPFKSVFLKEVFELYNYIDRSQLTPELGGYLVYCHQSWVTFLKEIDGFVQEFLSVVHRLPSCIATLHTLSRQAVPASVKELKDFCSANEARFQQLQRELGLDDLLRHCEQIVEKLRFPENEPCYQDMAGTALFTHTAYDMLQNYNRITAAVEKVDLLWQQAFSRAHLQLRILQLRDEAKQIIDLMDKTTQEKLQPYRIEMAKDAEKAQSLKADFETSVYRPAMALVHRADDVLRMLAESMSPVEIQAHGEWIMQLDRVKEKFLAALDLPYQTLKAVSDFYYYYNKSKTWYDVVLCENFFQDLLWNGTQDSIPKLHCLRVMRASRTPPWKQAVCDFLKKNPPPEMEELVQLAHLANVISDPHLQQNGRWLSHRCMILRKLLTSPGAVALNDLQVALQWQYEFLRGTQRDLAHVDSVSAGQSEKMNCAESTCCHLGEIRGSGSMLDVHSRPIYEGLSNGTRLNPGREGLLPHQPLAGLGQGMVHSSGKPHSLSSFDSGFDGAGSTHTDVVVRRESWGAKEAFRPVDRQPRIHEENISSVSDSEEREEFEFARVGGTSNASIQVIPKITVDSLNVEIKVKRRATLPKNPWLSLPVEDLENSYTVTIAPSAEDSHPTGVIQSQDQPSRTEICESSPTSTAEEQRTASFGTGETPARTDILQTQDSFDDSGSSLRYNLLSSTITDAQEKADDSTDSFPSLLWDTYDFHNTKQDSSERLVNSLDDVSLNDWDLKEQEGLQEVETILDRTAEILQAKENVLAQEEILDLLLKTESSSRQWVMSECEDQPRAVAVLSRDLLEAGVEFDDSCFTCSDERADYGSCPCARVVSDDGDLRQSDAQGVSEIGKQIGRCDLLEELRGLRVLEEQIMEENLKIRELRLSEETEVVTEEQLDQSAVQTSNQEREVFLQEQDKKQEVEKVNLRNETAKENLKDRLHSGRKVIRCSVMDGTFTTKQDSTLCDDLLSACKKQLPDDEHLNTAQHLNEHFSETDGVTLRWNNQDGADRTGVSPDDDLGMDRPINDDIKMSAYLGVLCDKMDSVISLSSPTSGVCSPKMSALGNDRKGIQRFLGSEGPNLDEDKGSASLQLGQLPLEESDSQLVGRVGSLNSEPPLNPGPHLSPEGETVMPPVPKPRKTTWLCKPDGNQSASEGEPKSNAPGCRQDSPEPGLRQQPGTPPKPKARRNKPATAAAIACPEDNISNSNNNNDLRLTESLGLQGAPPNTVVPDESSSEDPDMPTACSIPSGSGKEPGLDCEEGGLGLGPPGMHLSPDRLMEQEDPSSSRLLYVVQGSSQCCRSPVSTVSLHSTAEIYGFKTPVVLDTGSGLMKAGFADQDLPTAVFPTVIGVPKYEEVMNWCGERETYIGHEAQHMRGVLALRYPMKHGIVQNWDEMEKIWQHAFQQLCVAPEDHPVLLTEAAMSPLENRQRMVELMFEAFCVPYTYVAMQAVLALYAAGKTTGVVFDSGDGVSHSVPVFEGYCLPHAVQRFTLAGADVTLHLRKLLQERGVTMNTSAELEIVREVKEQCCYVARDYEAEISRVMMSPDDGVSYTMPDGRVVSIGAERFRAPEILFRPELIGRDHYGVHESIFKSILHSDIDLRKSFVGNIVLSGGNTLLAGLPLRLQSEIRSLVPEDLVQCVRVTSPADRDSSVWTGGAVLASLPSFGSAWISQEEYEEFGPQIVFRKCF